MRKVVFCSSVEEKDRLLESGYALVAVSGFMPDGKFTYMLERGSDWSRMLGGK